MIELKTSDEIELMREAGRIVAGLLAQLSASLRSGMKTKALDEDALAFEIEVADGKLGHRGRRVQKDPAYIWYVGRVLLDPPYRPFLTSNLSRSTQRLE